MRQVAFQRRLKLSPLDRDRWSQMMMENFLKTVELPPPGSVISGYVTVNGEIDVRPLLLHLVDKGYTCCVPRVLDREARLAYMTWHGEMPMVPSLYGIPEPDPDYSEEVIPQLMIVPLVAFDEKCHRLGYGSGQHDRTFPFLRRIHNFHTVGIAYEVQKFDVVPVDSHDYDLDMVITEARVYRHPERPA